MKKLLCQSISTNITKAYGRKIATSLTRGGVILLEGELGAGKTTLVQGLAEGFDITQRITSPTFTLINIYAVNRPNIKYLIHIDLYRLTSNDLSMLDLDHWQNDTSALIIVEWPERAKTIWKNVLGNIKITTGDDIALRKLEISGELTSLLQ